MNEIFSIQEKKPEINSNRKEIKSQSLFNNSKLKEEKLEQFSSVSIAIS